VHDRRVSSLAVVCEPGAAKAHEEAEEDNARPIRRGWWQRRFTST